MNTKIYLYDANGSDKEINLEDVKTENLDDKKLLWVDISRRDSETIKNVADNLKLKDVPLKTILNENERPKVDVFGDFFRFLIVSVEIVENNQISKIAVDIIAGKNFVITIHEGKVEYFKAFWEREKGETQIGELDAESFIATLLDLHIVSYFRALEVIEEQVDKLDERVLKEDLDAAKFFAEIVRLRQKVSNLRRWFLPHRDVFYALSRPDFRQFAESDSAEYFLQLNQHFENAFDAIESSRDTLLGLFDLYASKSTQQTNFLVQRLTFITIIIGLLGVIAGILGMNFEADYVFKSEYGFFLAIGAMLLFAISLTVLAKFRGYI